MIINGAASQRCTVACWVTGEAPHPSRLTLAFIRLAPHKAPSSQRAAAEVKETGGVRQRRRRRKREDEPADEESIINSKSMIFRKSEVKVSNRIKDIFQQPQTKLLEQSNHKLLNSFDI